MQRMLGWVRGARAGKARRRSHILRPRETTMRTGPLVVEHRVQHDHLGNWALWILAYSVTLWLMSFTEIDRGLRHLVAILVAIALAAFVKRNLPTRPDGRKLPRPVSAAMLLTGLFVSQIYLWTT